MTGLRLGVVGDLHTHWDDIDVAQFNATRYDLLFFTGDLGGGSVESSLRVARTISRLDVETLVMPGNNDTGDIHQLAAELSHRSGLKRLTGIRQGAGDAIKPIRLCGYSSHRYRTPAADVTLIAARPHSMGGPTLTFADHMSATYGISSLEASAKRLKELVDAAETADLVFLSHNGPTGLGGEPADMWGCDFKPDGGDWGDPDLREAIAHAVATGRRVLAVVAGHMHLKTKCGQERPWRREHDGILYVNAARVPRIYSGSDDVMRHHVSLHIHEQGIEIDELEVPQGLG
jgi:uncharacterized protein (TIGR04168 family)